MASGFRPWLPAWVDAAYSAKGFWRSAQPLDHFRTASNATTQLAGIVASLLDEHPEVEAVVELGAGDGTLLSRLSELRPRLDLTGVDLRPRPAGCPSGVGWSRGLWDVTTGSWVGAAQQLLADLRRPTLILCVEWLDDLPCTVLTRSENGLQVVEVDGDGRERSGSQASRDDASWAASWSPWSRRLEIGSTRDRAWAEVCRLLRRPGGLALLVDYGHVAAARPVGGSLAGYRLGRRVPPRPSFEVNLTAGVAVDSVAAAGQRAGARTLLQARQSEVVRAASEPARPAGTLDDLVARSELWALAANTGWGQQWWLLQQVAAVVD